MPDTRDEPRMRAGRGRTHDPWPCCGEQPEEPRGRPKNTVCPECKDLLRLAKERLADGEAAGRKIYRWAESPRDMPSLVGKWEFGDDAAEKRLYEALFNLVETLTERAPGDAYWNDGPQVIDQDKGRGWGYNNSVNVTMDPGVRNAVDALDTALREALADVYAEGADRGRNILLNLAEGDLSVNEFNRRTKEGAHIR